MIFNFFKKTDPKNVVVYGMGTADDERAADALGRDPHLRARLVRTLMRDKLAGARLQHAKAMPAHIDAAIDLIEHVLPSGAPVHFITFVDMPFVRHTRAAFFNLFSSTGPFHVGKGIATPANAYEAFKALPTSLSTRWFEDEYLPGTGLDVYATPFNKEDGYCVYEAGAHRLLLISSTLSPKAKARVISAFLGHRIKAWDKSPAPLQQYINYFETQCAKAAPQAVLDDLFAGRMAQHFFDEAAVRAYKATLEQAEANIHFATDHTPTRHDGRIVRGMAACLQQAGEITRPLEMLNSLPEKDERTQQDIDILAGQQAILNTPYPFAPKASSAPFTPNKKTVLYNPHQCLPFHTSGYATRTHGIVKGLADCGWDMRVFSRAGYPLDTRVDNEGIFERVIDGLPYICDCAPEGRPQNTIPPDEYLAKATDYLIECAHKVRPAIIHTASNYICGVAGVAAARKLGLPSIYEMRGLWHVTRWSKEPQYNLTDKFAQAEKLELEAAENATHVLAITNALKEWLVDHGIDENKISLAPNAVDLNQFERRPKDADFAREVGCEGKIVVGYIGSFVQYEGLDLLVQALAMLAPSTRQNVRFLWIGDGPVLPDLLKMAQDLGVEDNIISLGRRPFDEVPRAYSIVDIAAFPRKGQVICEIVSPLKPFEAMAMEKAVIVSNVRPLKEIITHGQTGLIHAKDDAKSLAEALGRFCEDEALRAACGKEARAWIEHTRQWNIIASNIADVYTSFT